MSKPVATYLVRVTVRAAALESPPDPDSPAEEAAGVELELIAPTLDDLTATIGSALYAAWPALAAKVSAERVDI